MYGHFTIHRPLGRTLRGIAALLCMLAALGCSTSTQDEDIRKKVDYHYRLANTSFYEHNIPGALRELTQCLKLDPEHADAHHLMGMIFFGRREYSESENHFRQALELRPAFHEARNNLGAVLLAEKRWRDAIEVLKPLVGATLYGTPWLVHNNLGHANHQLKRRRKAMHHYKQALFHNPKCCLGYANLGTLYREIGDAEMALDYLGRATTKCEKFAEPHFQLGQLYEHIGQHATARAQYRECYKDAPESPLGRRCRRRM